MNYLKERLIQMYKVLGAILGFVLVRLFVLSEIEVMGFKMFIEVLTGGMNFGGGSRLDAINFKTLTSDTSIKLILGSAAGFYIGNWYEKKSRVQSKENQQGEM